MSAVGNRWDGDDEGPHDDHDDGADEVRHDYGEGDEELSDPPERRSGDTGRTRMEQLAYGFSHRLTGGHRRTVPVINLTTPGWHPDRRI